MTEPGIYYPPALTALQLDAFLAKGWYRMGQRIFTTNYIVHDDQFLRVYWLRYQLEKIDWTKSLQKILKANAPFTTTIEPLVIDDAIEELFVRYRSGINFEPAASVRHWLYEFMETNVYDSRVIKVMHESKLIAAGIFDKGQESIAGILNFYDPDYKRCTPRKFLMLQKILYAQSNQLKWYYPGYIVQHYPKFNYKLFAGLAAAQLYLPEQNQWQPYDPVLLEKPSF